MSEGYPGVAAHAAFPIARGSTRCDLLGGLGMDRLPSDAVGTMTLTLTNLVVGSAIRIERAAGGAEVASRTAASADEAFALDYYGFGNANNTLRIKVRKGTAAPKCLPLETFALLGNAAQSIYIAQVADPIA